MPLFWSFSCRSLHCLVFPTKNSLACSFCIRLSCPFRNNSIFPHSVVVFSFHFFCFLSSLSLSFSETERERENASNCISVGFESVYASVCPSVRFMLLWCQMKRCHIGQKVALLTVFLMTVASLKATCEYSREIPSLFIACRCRKSRWLWRPAPCERNSSIILIFK